MCALARHLTRGNQRITTINSFTNQNFVCRMEHQNFYTPQNVRQIKTNPTRANWTLRHYDTWGSWGITPGNLNLSVGWRWIVDFIPRSIYAWSTKSGYSLDRSMAGPQGRYSHRGKEKQTLGRTCISQMHSPQRHTPHLLINCILLPPGRATWLHHTYTAYYKPQLHFSVLQEVCTIPQRSYNRSAWPQSDTHFMSHYRLLCTPQCN
jgi:hypothetical protein